MLTADQQRVKQLLSETITLLCKNGLHFRNEFCINALIGITLDQHDVFLVTINETVYSSDTFVRNHGVGHAGDLAALGIRSGLRGSDGKHIFNDPRFGSERSERRDFRQDRHRDLPGDFRSLENDAGPSKSSGDLRISPSRGGGSSRSLKSHSVDSQSAKRSDSRLSHSDAKSGNDFKSGERKSSSRGDADVEKKSKEEKINSATEAEEIRSTRAELEALAAAALGSTTISSPLIASVDKTESVNEDKDDDDDKDDDVRSNGSGSGAGSDAKSDDEYHGRTSDAGVPCYENDDIAIIKTDKARSRRSSRCGSAEGRSSRRPSSVQSEEPSEAGNLEINWHSDAEHEDENGSGGEEQEMKRFRSDSYRSGVNHSSEGGRGFEDGRLERRREGNRDGDDEEDCERLIEGRSESMGRRYSSYDDRDDKNIFVKQEPQNFYAGDYMDGRNSASYRGYDRNTSIGSYSTNNMEGFSGNSPLDKSRFMKGDSESSPGSVGGYQRFGSGDGPAGGAVWSRRDSGYDMGSPHSAGKRSQEAGSSGSIAAVAAATAAAATSNRSGLYFGSRPYPDVKMDSKMGVLPGSSGDSYYGGLGGGMGSQGGGLGMYDDALRLSQKGVDSQWSNRRQRAQFTHYQIERLESTFNKSRYVGTAERAELSRELNINENIIQDDLKTAACARKASSIKKSTTEQVWFQNRRQKLKKQMTARISYHNDSLHSEPMPKMDFDIGSYMAEQLGRSSMGSGGGGGPPSSDLGGYDYPDLGKGDDGSRGDEDSGQEGGLNGGEYSN